MNKPQEITLPEWKEIMDITQVNEAWGLHDSTPEDFASQVYGVKFYFMSGTPGLQIFYPLDSKSLLLLIDADSYRGRFKDSSFIDLTERSDVSQLNALQLHHSLNTVYFAMAAAADYVQDLWTAHKGRIVQPRISASWKHGWLVDGKSVDVPDAERYVLRVSTSRI